MPYQSFGQKFLRAYIKKNPLDFVSEDGRNVFAERHILEAFKAGYETALKQHAKRERAVKKPKRCKNWPNCACIARGRVKPGECEDQSTFK